MKVNPLEKEGFHYVLVVKKGATRSLKCKELQSKVKSFIIFGLLRGALRVPEYKETHWIEDYKRNW